MSLNNIELGDWIVSELYRDTLLATEARPGAGPSVKPIPPSATAPAQSTRPPAGNTPAPGASIASIPAQGANANFPLATSAPAGDTQTSASGKSSPASPPPGTTVPGYKFLGNNRRNITILVQSPGSAFLPDDQLAFLTKMLEACRMNMGDVAIVNLATAPVNIALLKQQLRPAILLLFGMEPVAIKLPMNFPVFKIQAYDACTYLSAPSLEDLVRPGDENKLLKSKLWMCLKTIFEI